MFNSKLKKQIASLEDRIWQLENPPKYKVGSKIDKVWIVCEVHKATRSIVHSDWIRYGRPAYFKLVNIKTGETETI
jgi:hypothetical protein